MALARRILQTAKQTRVLLSRRVTSNTINEEARLEDSGTVKQTSVPLSRGVRKKTINEDAVREEDRETVKQTSVSLLRGVTSNTINEDAREEDREIVEHSRNLLSRGAMSNEGAKEEDLETLKQTSVLLSRVVTPNTIIDDAREGCETVKQTSALLSRGVTSNEDAREEDHETAKKTSVLQSSGVMSNEDAREEGHETAKKMSVLQSSGVTSNEDARKDRKTVTQSSALLSSGVMSNEDAREEDHETAKKMSVLQSSGVTSSEDAREEGRKTVKQTSNLLPRGVISNEKNEFAREEDSYSYPITAFPLQMDPKGKVAIITGGETGIGLATAHDLLAAGVQVVVLAGVRDGETAVRQITETHGEGRACFMHMDVNDPREFEELFYRVDSLFRSIDIVFNNAGIMQDQLWEYEVDTNLKSALRGTILGLDYMGREGRGRRKGGGVVVNHADVAALDGFPYAPCYAATKAGVLAATRSFGADYHYGRSGVRVVGLLTGSTDTALLQQVEDKQLDAEWGRAAADQLTRAPPQSPAVVGRALTQLVRHAGPATLWTVDRGQLYLTTIPDSAAFNTKITEF